MLVLQEAKGLLGGNMKKMFMTGLLVFAMLFLASSDAQAQRKYSSSSSSSSKPSTSSSFGKSYSNGSSGSSFGKSAVAQSSSGKSYTSGSPPSKVTPAQPTTPPASKYSNGPPKTGPPAASSNSSKPPSKGWNPGLSAAAQKEQSKQAYQKATKPAEAPKPTYRSSTGVEKPLNPQAPQVQTVRRYVTHERYITYENRATVFYGPYYGHPIYYNDWYSPFIMGYLLSASVNANERAYWVYCHRADMDQARYNELLAKDAELSARLRVLENKNSAVDPNFVLPSMRDNPDLQYSHDFVTATYNPQSVAPPDGGDDDGGTSSGVGHFFFWLFVVVLILGAVGLGVWLMFFKDW